LRVVPQVLRMTTWGATKRDDSLSCEQVLTRAARNGKFDLVRVGLGGLTRGGSCRARRPR
jgi:hypothetical protein